MIEREERFVDAVILPSRRSTRGMAQPSAHERLAAAQSTRIAMIDVKTRLATIATCSLVS